MKEEMLLKEKIRLLEKEITTLAEKIESLEKELKEVYALKTEIKALKVFMGRAHPEFKKEFLDIVKKCT